MEYFHLTTPQKNIWNLQKYYEGTAIGNQCGTIIFNEERNIALLQQAICQFIRSQSGIRLRFCEESEPRQYVSEEIDTTIPFLSFSCMDELDRYAECFSQTPIGLVNTQMYRFIVFQVDQKSGILVTLSHLISDAWTFGLMANQIDVAYRQLAEVANLLPAKTADALLKADYIDYVQFENTYLSSERYIKDKKYWEEKYSSCPEKSQIKTCAIPTQSVEAKRIIKTLPLDLKWKMEKYCKEYSVSPAVLFETALITYLSKINSESTSITIGILVLNRSNAKQKNIAGMFISTMPLTITLSENMTLAGLATQITKEHIGIFRHQKYPYSDILAFLRERQNFSGNLYDVMVSYQNAKTNTDAETKWYSNGSSEVPFALHIDDRDGSNEYTLTVDYQTDIFREDVEIELIIDRLEYILEQITENSTRFIKDVCIIPKQEFKKLIFEFNDTHANYQKDKCVHELFFDQVNKTPDKPALIYENKEFSYRQLNELTNSLAHFLRKAGVKPNDVVPIMAERSWQIIVAMLGILKAGGAFMSIDITHPIERIKYILKSTKPKMILVSNMEIQTGVIDKLNSAKNTIIDLSKFDFSDNCENIENVNHPDDLCYVIYTSGSTGTPKGLSICHRNGVNFCNKNHFNVNNKIISSADTVFLSITNTIFDMFITELFIPLTSGMTILFANEQEASMGEPLELLCKKRHPNIIETTPTKLKMLLSSGTFTSISNFKAIILGGEPLTSTFYKYLRERTSAKIFNNYGPAETTVWSTISEVTDKDINIGKPTANTQIYIIDKNNAPLPIGVAGELCIAGDGVGKGYLNRPDLTVEKFVSNPFSTKENHLGKTMYHTGDLARRRADGNIEYLGRIDTQVKIRGLRIELEEIENVMGSMDGINLTAVTDKRDENNRQYLVGYYTSDVLIDERKLRKHLSTKLPKYMVPNYFMRLDSMPMTSGGKTDRKNLPTPNFTMQITEYVKPVTEQECKLCHLLETLLHMKQVGTADDFFELGGDSLTAIEFVAQAHAMGIHFTLQNVFDYPTIQSLCDFIRQGEKASIHYEPADFDKYHKLLSKNIVDETFVPTQKPFGNVLLTGATGFLGAHVLEQLLQADIGKIYCLIRNRQRLHDILKYYFDSKYDPEWNHRIIPLVGDIEQESLTNDMPTDVQTVIHTAASVKHYGAYDYFHRANTQGTKNVANYAKSIGAKLIHVSTLSVSGNSMADDFSVYYSGEEKQFYETSFYIGQPLDNVYIRSKFEAERAVYDAMLDGLEAKIIRVGNLTNRTTDFKFQPNYVQNAFLTRLKAMLEFGLFPDYLRPLYVEFSPVDLTAKGIIQIAQFADEPCIFHLNSNRTIYFDRFLEIIRELGISMKIVNGTTFYNALQETLKNNDTSYIFEAFQNDMDEHGRLVYDSNIHIKNDFTVWFLKRLDFEWNRIDAKYVSEYINYFRKLGYLKV